MPGVEPLKPSDAPELQSFFDVWTERMGYVPNTLLTLARKPKVVRALAALSEAVHDPETSISPELRTLVGVMASMTHGCNFCLAHTAANASRAGAAAEKIDHVWEYETNDLFDEADRAALDFARAAASVPNAVTEENYEALRRYFSDEEIIEILNVVAYYGWYNRWNASMGTVLEEIPRDFAEEHLKSTKWEVGRHEES
ncbi:peroxidase-related enzyme [Parasphingopyxis algicola]|uniref:carboxymuconolactone decarboxylase family protein n=1 Tax=Parasphingopyxis algicola TaxID=2026624 RepID=UPI0015A36754|nr:peroxidase-related enzyme [Parasphingopyxis algicola]QLC25053.1 peroxidase-related enzyme [Parasphingopyxis algicola]